MAITIIATPSAPDANSYATMAESDAYHATHPYSTTWDEADEDQKARALVTATRQLDTWYDWAGSITTLEQALLWPRRGVYRPGATAYNGSMSTDDWHEPFGILLPADEIPVRIREATAELARQLLDGDRTADSDLETQGLTSLKAGPVFMQFRQTSAKPIPDAVASMVSPLGTPRTKSGSGAISMYRG